VLASGHQLVATARRPEQLDELVREHGDQVRAVAGARQSFGGPGKVRIRPMAAEGSRSGEANGTAG